MKPTIGSPVHFHDDGGPYHAIVTAVNSDDTLELVTFGRNSVYFQHGVREVAAGRFAEALSSRKGRWSWPAGSAAKAETAAPTGHLSARVFVLAKRLKELAAEVHALRGSPNDTHGQGSGAAYSIESAAELLGGALGNIILLEDAAS